MNDGLKEQDDNLLYFIHFVSCMSKQARDETFISTFIFSKTERLFEKVMIGINNKIHF